MLALKIVCLYNRPCTEEFARLPGRQSQTARTAGGAEAYTEEEKKMSLEENKTVVETEEKDKGAAGEETVSVENVSAENVSVETAPAEEAPAEDTAAEDTPAKGVSSGNDITGKDDADSPDTGSRGGRTAQTDNVWTEKWYDEEFSKEQWILTHIGDENLLEYLKMEQRREEELQRAKETKQKRILSAFQLTVSLAAIVMIIFLLRDNPTVMVNILYIIAIIGALWIWKNPKSK